ncbi:MAG: hypothetical protein FJZ11_07605 [Candidatus Omnitrophica bacterium]|nr:hypothetical protein [Candidatus Omnitrophota bacterium]
MIKSKLVLIFLFTVIIFQFQATSWAEYDPVSATEGWSVIESKYCTIFCHPKVDINKVNSRIQIRFYDINGGRFSAKNKSAEEQLAEKFDRLLLRVEKILDMYPRKLHLKAMIYKNQAQIDEVYIRIFNYSDGEERISFYVHKFTTVFTAEQVIREGVLAHEMGHAVVDHYFVVLPPEKIKELLSQYVELHLED